MKIYKMEKHAALIACFIIFSCCFAVADDQTPEKNIQAKELVNNLAKCSAAHTTNIMLLRATGQNADHLAPITEWFYYGAAALSSEETTKDLFTMHYKRYLATNSEIQKMGKDAQVIAVKKFVATLNHDMDDCDLLKSANETLVNRYIKKP